MRAVRPAAVALLALAMLLILVGPRQAAAASPQLPSAPTTAPPRATSLPGADEMAQSLDDDILTSGAIVLVSGVVGIAGLMWGRL